MKLAARGSLAPVRGRYALAGLLLLVSIGCRVREGANDHHGKATAATAEMPAASTRILYPGAPGSFVDLVASAKHGVVAIRAATPVKSGPAAMFPGAPETTADVALGTGFLIEAKGVFVLTNDHIAAASTELKVVLPDRSEVPAKLVGRDTALDLALLSLGDVPRLTPLPLGDSNNVQVGEWLVVLGNPFGDDVTASVGVVSATGREGAGSLAAGRQMGYRTFIQTDARIHRGNSGGPVIDTAGQVIGVAVANGDRAGEVSFAIPIERVREVVGALRDVGNVSRSWLGATVLPINKERAEQLGMPKVTGALVTGVEPSSPAIRAALRAGDVILKWDGREVDHRSLPWLVAQAPPGKTVAVVLWRNRVETPVVVVTDRMPQ
ncbi:MAG TPA: trypsin-like peptidase domain-containing protein [Kofleriaceae bacterium]